MTVGKEEVHATAAGPGAVRAGRGGLTDHAATQLGLIVGGVGLLAVTSAAQLLLNNTYGPLGEHQSAGKWSALGCGAAAAGLALALTRLVAMRSRTGVAALLVATVLAWVVLSPRAIDVSESWVPRPNERYACTGWTFRHYPPGTMDASSTTYCIGFEHRIADG